MARRKEWMKEGKKKETDRCQSSQGITADLHATTHFHPNISTFSVCVSPRISIPVNDCDNTKKTTQSVSVLRQRQPRWNWTFGSWLFRKQETNSWISHTDCALARVYNKLSMNPHCSGANYVSCHTYSKRSTWGHRILHRLVFFQLIGKVVENEILLMLLLKYRCCLFLAFNKPKLLKDESTREKRYISLLCTYTTVHY